VTPYADFDYFLFLLYPLSVLVVLGALGRSSRWLVLVTSLAIVLFQYGEPLAAGAVGHGLRQMVFLGAYAAGGIALVLVYSALRPRSPGNWLLIAALAIALAPLVAIKLYPLLHGSHASARDASSPSSQLPGGTLGLFDSFGFLGISYVTLRLLDAIIVVHDGVVKRRPRAADLASYLLFAPTISAGPIDRLQRFTAALDELPRSGREYARHVEAGIHRIAQGFLYKFIIAYLIYQHALTPLDHRSGVLATVGYMYAFSGYLFFDFAGYSAFAIGVGHFFGIRVPENFDAPFLSRNFREIWDRWHITLSWWLRDHVYMRFMLAATRRRWFRGNRVRAHHIGLLLTMTLMGCWHGLETRYVVYGLYQGLMLVLYDVGERWNKRRKLVGDGPLAQVASVLLTANLFCFGLLIFSGRLFGHHG